MKKRILSIISVVIIIVGIVSFLNIRYLIPIKLNKQWSTPKITKDEELTLNFLNNKMTDSKNGIYTNYIDQPSSKDITKGHAVLSESEGLIMLYAVEQGDKELFDRHCNIVMKKMLLKSNSVAWRIDNGTLAETSATIDDFRIIKALIYGYDRWKEFNYRKYAIKISDSILKNNITSNLPVDFKDGYGKSKSVTICYLDVNTMGILESVDRRWKDKYNESKQLISKAYISDKLPLYKNTYDVSKQGFVEQKDADTLLSLITSLYLKQDGEDITTTVNWVKERLAADGALYAMYDINTGKPSTDIRSTAIYSIAAMMAKEAGDTELYNLLIKKLLEFQIVDKSNEIYGAFGNAETKELYSFDNLNAILAMQK